MGIVTANVTVGSLYIESGFTDGLTVNNGVTLTVSNQLIIGDSLVGYWRFDKPTGTPSIDSSGYGASLAYTNTPVTSRTCPTTLLANTYSIDSSTPATT